eukprot:TRINITY_DN23095_c0_g1_i4.p1 TRINITY_DN23095_c0_g1~~TRINITY_DN23095_c0_g1_i4.p1  ORF type:complete len:605 (-),score=41.43 TRINITY_DN23095_c0_g1_i4:249-2063(-)
MHLGEEVKRSCEDSRHYASQEMVKPLRLRVQGLLDQDWCAIRGGRDLSLALKVFDAVLYYGISCKTTDERRGASKASKAESSKSEEPEGATEDLTGLAFERTIEGVISHDDTSSGLDRLDKAVTSQLLASAQFSCAVALRFLPKQRLLHVLHCVSNECLRCGRLDGLCVVGLGGHAQSAFERASLLTLVDPLQLHTHAKKVVRTIGSLRGDVATQEMSQLPEEGEHEDSTRAISHVHRVSHSSSCGGLPSVSEEHEDAATNRIASSWTLSRACSSSAVLMHTEASPDGSDSASVGTPKSSEGPFSPSRQRLASLLAAAAPPGHARLPDGQQAVPSRVARYRHGRSSSLGHGAGSGVGNAGIASVSGSTSPTSTVSHGGTGSPSVGFSPSVNTELHTSGATDVAHTDLQSLAKEDDLQIDDGTKIVTAYVQHTGDIQSAALLFCEASHLQSPPLRLGYFFALYQALLARWQLFRQRAGLQNLVTACLPPTDELEVPDKRKWNLTCSKCKSQLLGTPVLDEQGARQVCPNGECGEPLPGCSICLQPVLSLRSTDQSSFLLEATGQLAWCESCRHGGHLECLQEWFKHHDSCPVPSCNCQCGRLRGY